MDVDTIIPAMMVDAGGSSLQLGILTAIMLGGGRFVQLLFAPFVNNRPAAKKGIFSIRKVISSGELKNR